MFFFPVKLFDTNINRLWLISFIFDSSLLLEGKAKSYKEETLIKQQIKALWTLVVFFFFSTCSTFWYSIPLPHLHKTHIFYWHFHNNPILSQKQKHLFAVSPQCVDQTSWMGRWCYGAQGSGPSFFGTRTVSLPTVGNTHLTGQRDICSWLSLGQRCSSSFTELSAPNKDREQSSNAEVRFYKSSFRWESYYLPIFHMLKSIRTSCFPQILSEGSKTSLCFPFTFFPLLKKPGFFYSFKRKRMTKKRMHSEKI